MALEDPTGNWFLVNQGRRRGDAAVAVDWSGRRLCILSNVPFRRGLDLEPLTAAPRGFTAVILYAVGWRGPVYVAFRSDWTPDDYFIHAAKLFGEQGRTP